MELKHNRTREEKKTGNRSGFVGAALLAAGLMAGCAPALHTGAAKDSDSAMLVRCERSRGDFAKELERKLRPLLHDNLSTSGLQKVNFMLVFRENGEINVNGVESVCVKDGCPAWSEIDILQILDRTIEGMNAEIKPLGCECNVPVVIVFTNTG